MALFQLMHCTAASSVLGNYQNNPSIRELPEMESAVVLIKDAYNNSQGLLHKVK